MAWFRVAGLTRAQEAWAAWGVEEMEREGLSPASVPLVKGGVVHLPDVSVAERLVEVLEEGAGVEVTPVPCPGAGRTLAQRLRERLVRLEG